MFEKNRPRGCFVTNAAISLDSHSPDEELNELVQASFTGLEEAFYGLSRMGFSMAENLLNAGHRLTVYNRTFEKVSPLLARGGPG